MKSAISFSLMQCLSMTLCKVWATVSSALTSHPASVSWSPSEIDASLPCCKPSQNQACKNTDKHSSKNPTWLKTFSTKIYMIAPSCEI